MYYIVLPCAEIEDAFALSSPYTAELLIKFIIYGTYEYIYVYVYMYVYIFIYIHTYMHVCVVMILDVKLTFFS